eukprot:m.75493 g.75493  ORF g.75493 m.75493 type:complete len:105 (+) comp13983_c2_seq2:1890-2204(+)
MKTKTSEQAKAKTKKDRQKTNEQTETNERSIHRQHQIKTDHVTKHQIYNVHEMDVKSTGECNQLPEVGTERKDNKMNGPQDKQTPKQQNKHNNHQAAVNAHTKE